MWFIKKANICIKDENERISEEFLEFLLCFSGVTDAAFAEKVEQLGLIF